MKTKILVLALALTLASCKNETKNESVAEPTETSELTAPSASETSKQWEVHPISHATMVLNWEATVLYVDPVGGAEAFANQPKPDLILVTDIHGDHLNVETLEAISTVTSKIIVPKAVADKLPESLSNRAHILNNGDSKEFEGFTIEAIPMYNLREEALKFHEKGRGNGYVIEKKGKRVYISGDTEDIPEMRSLENIDVAFVCMNLPYTMTVESAASAVLDFQPKTVYPYHYRGTEGLSDVGKFEQLVQEGNNNITVEQLDWYKNSN